MLQPNSGPWEVQIFAHGFKFCYLVPQVHLLKSDTSRWKFLKSSFEGQNTHVGGFLVIVNLVYPSGQAKVSNLHNVVLCHQNISGCQVSVDALQTEGGQRITTTYIPKLS